VTPESATQSTAQADHQFWIARPPSASRLPLASRRLRHPKLEADQTQATAKVAAQAQPESTDFAKLVTWVSRGAIQPGADDFSMLWLLFRTFLPQVGGLVLMLAQRAAE